MYRPNIKMYVDVNLWSSSSSKIEKWMSTEWYGWNAPFQCSVLKLCHNELMSNMVLVRDSGNTVDPKKAFTSSKEMVWVQRSK